MELINQCFIDKIQLSGSGFRRPHQTVFNIYKIGDAIGLCVSPVSSNLNTIRLYSGNLLLFVFKAFTAYKKVILNIAVV